MLNIQDGISSIKRIKTGVPGLDTIIQGGFPKNSITLVSGPPGGGKSILCFQFLWDGIKNNEKCLFLTLDKKSEGLIIQAKELGLNFEPAIEQGLIKFEFLNINKKQIYEKMTNEILSKNYDRIVLDSITPLSEMPIFMRNLEDLNIDTNNLIPDDFPDGTILPTRRLHLHYIMSALESSNCTSIITSELPLGSNMLSRDGISEFLADGVITLSFDPTMDRRKLAVMKMRNTKHTLKPQSMQIDTGGIKLV
jgi:circadian clock protein KaiC